jgi:alkanesulfonate monooxygenase SsuD/methylene tetrahydromethanopterin reductase-like flavin-dependent oxidoreductase (luciferase family)
MKFGIFYEHQLPRPWAEDSEQQLINDALEQVELADKLGFDVVWEVEHHFLEEYSHSSAPEVFLAACSQRAPNIRLGHGIVQTPPPFNHPARVAERIAMLDLVSNGRVEFGTGESSSEAELGGFRIDPVLKREMWQEGLEVAVRCMTETPFGGVDGKYVQMPPRNVVPKPVQKPHPPLWVACSRRDTIHLAAQKGIGALTFAFIDPEEAEHWIADYYTTLENECVPIGTAVNPNIACVTTFMCAPTEEAAIERGIEGANFFGYSLAHFYVFGQHVPGKTDVWAEYLQKRDEVGYSAEVAAAAEQDRLGAKIAQDGITGLRGAVGTPEQIRDYLRRYEECGVDQIIFVSQAGKNKHEHIMESLELFGREVLPEFMDRDEQQVKRKTSRVEPLIEKAMARKVDDAPRMPDDYVMPAMPRAWADQSGDENIKQMLEKIAEDRAAGRRDPSAGIVGGNL